jgi:hypothetical protein
LPPSLFDLVKGRADQLGIMLLIRFVGIFNAMPDTERISAVAKEALPP